jgi:hypothetical protein
MISLIICSRTPDISSDLRNNIFNKIGVEFEIICVDNSNNEYNIFEAYNFGASQARYNVLCFMHGDILYHTDDWGNLVLSKLSENNDIGVIGVAGATCKSKMNSPWWISDLENCEQYLRYNLLQHFKDGVKHLNIKEKEESKVWNEVVLLDGVWFCCKKELWKINKFDDKSYEGFHFYDLDFTFSAFKKGFKNYVCQNILIEHFSAGDIETKWIDSSFTFHNKWKLSLPASVGALSLTESKSVELLAKKNFLSILSYNKYRRFYTWIKLWMQVFLINPFNKKNVITLLRYCKVYFK